MFRKSQTQILKLKLKTILNILIFCFWDAVKISYKKNSAEQ